MFWHQFHPCVEELEVFVACSGTRVHKAENKEGVVFLSSVLTDEGRRCLGDMPRWFVKRTNLELVFSD